MASQLSSLQLIGFAFLTFVLAGPRIKFLLVASLLSGVLGLHFGVGALPLAGSTCGGHIHMLRPAAWVCSVCLGLLRKWGRMPKSSARAWARCKMMLWAFLPWPAARVGVPKAAAALHRCAALPWERRLRSTGWWPLCAQCLRLCGRKSAHRHKC